MSSEFAEFLFSFACNKLESSPQLDLRQQLLHSNLIRHILLVHQQSSSTTSASTSTSTSSSSSSTSSSSPSTTAVSTSAPSSSTPSEDQPQSLCLPPLPPSPPLSPVPQSHHHVFASPSATFGHPTTPYQTFPPQFPETPVLGQIHSNWTPFSYDDELDRIHSRQSLDGNLFQDLDVDMEEDPSDPTLYLGQNDNYDTNLRFGFHPYFAESQPQMEDYDFESSQAQEDWLDAVLEDLMEEDEQEDSSPDYDSDDDNDSFEEKELDINVTRGPSTQAVVLVAHKMESEEDAILGRLLDQSGQQLKQNHHHYQQQLPHHTHPSPSAPCPSLLHPCQSIDMYTSSHESPHPYHKSYLHQSFPTKEKGSTAIISTVGSKSTTSTASATAAASVAVSASRSLMVQRVPLDEPMLPQDHVSRIKQQQQRQLQLQNPSYFTDDAYYRSCPPCLGFHSSSRSYSQREQNEDALREQRFVQLTQELGSALVQEQEADPNPNLLLPEQQSFEDSFLFRSSISPAGGQTGFIALGH
ncbi:hypothetical protein BGX26_006146 [Mortierella sp. AD094]|nr:hypothetical protein BGX26_006146 [Mortierella sp. AD094]